jgi:type II secretory pathway component PulJ
MNSRRLIQRSARRASRGIALVELLCASAIILVVLAGTAVTFAAVQRSLLASLYQMNAQNDQNRVFCYLRRDLRGASSVQLAAQGTELTLSVPAPSTPTLNLNLGASLLSLLTPPQSAPASTTIRYYRQGTSIIREVAGEATELSASATRFQASLQGAQIRIDARFQPRFSLRGAASAQIETTTFVHLHNATQL